MRTTMDFFEAQADAHRQTLRLIALFALAVTSLIVLTVLLVGAAVAYSIPPTGTISWEKIWYALSPTLTLGIAGVVIVIVALASTFRLMSLSRGGRAVAETLGARLIQPNTKDPRERRLLNVVEEMAIAASLPVPPVFVVDEPGINAFAAGYSPDDAVIGVTEGTLDLLSRSELQGVIGHEFSHVLNGDMRLNIRLMAILFGILVIGIVGRSLVGGSGRSRRSSSKDGGAQVALVGLGLMIVGYVGSFFGNMIKAAVSRQREFLADASAVQFTRNPDGVAGALKKIGGFEAGSHLNDPRAEELSHMFFGQAFDNWFGGLLATHPQLDARIRSVDPQWDGTFPETVPAGPSGDEADPTQPSADPAEAFTDALEIVGSGAAGAAVAAAALGGLGTVSPGDVARAHALIDGIPRPLHDAAHDPFGARAVVYALLLMDIPDVLHAQREHLDAQAERGVPELLDRLLDAREALPAGSRLPLLQLCMPALKTLSDKQWARFRDNIVALIKADRSLDLEEWILHQVLMKQLRPHFEGVRHRRDGRRDLESLVEPVTTLLSRLALLQHDHAGAGQEAFEAAARVLDMPALMLDKREDPNLQRLNEALRQLQELHPLARPRLLKAAAACILHDGIIRAEEHDLLYAVAAVLDCPMPPLEQD